MVLFLRELKLTASTCNVFVQNLVNGKLLLTLDNVGFKDELGLNAVQVERLRLELAKYD